MDDLIIQFSRLWGQHETLTVTAKDEKISDILKGYDSIELRDLLLQWADEFYSNGEYEDTVEFFEHKVEEMYRAEYSLETMDPPSENRYFEIDLVDFDENNIPYNVGTVICSSPSGITKSDAEEICRDELEMSFEEVFSIAEISRAEALEHFEDAKQANIPCCYWARGNEPSKLSLDATIKAANIKREKQKDEDCSSVRNDVGER